MINRYTFRRMAMIQDGGWAVPTYTGSHAVFGNAAQGYMECYDSGTLTFSAANTVDVFIMSGGYSGSNCTGRDTSAIYGGDGGRSRTVTGIAVTASSYSVQVGSGGSRVTTTGTYANQCSGGYSSALGYTVYSTSGNTAGASGGKYGAYPNEGGRGGTGPHNPFGMYRYYGAGGGGHGENGWGFGGTTGGGKGGTSSGGDYTKNGYDATANTGSGGGSAYSTKSGSSAFYSGAGGSGLVIVRWGY